MAQPAGISIRDDSIKLGQFLKLAGIVGTGSEAKQLLASESVSVNGEVDSRRGRTLVVGDVVAVAGSRFVVEHAHADADDDYFDEATANDDFDPEKWRNV